ncbi:hypothetical protein PPYR_07479 [Photinus pyralis]|uniref:Equilibrative nucleoside transporter 3 n=1 Tax=Photinus pyralis TaxID=7054 RepID=A0A1Y1NIQ3_PHOPY|nr:equilibrative nucleoside transporter 1 [Photinus pyralis]KAB0799599.1 hypothetical protein PPYR_07479 [Photinus pyralis]
METANIRPLLDPISSDTDEEVHIPNINDDRIVAVKDDEPLFKPQEPRDKYNIVFFIFYLLGMTTLLPWNFFITANDYWMYKFRDPKSQLNFFSPPPKRTPLQASFTSYLSIASNVPCVIFLIVNTALNKRVSLNTRMIGSLIVMLILLVITTVFVKVDTDDWQTEFFAITLVTVVLLNVASAILSGSLFGIVGKFSPKYITAVFGGQALGAIFTALVQIMALSIGASSIFSGLIYYMVGNVVIVISIIFYIILSKAVYFKYHIATKMGADLHEFSADLLRPQLIDHKAILKKIWKYAASVFSVFFITLSVYPGVAVLIESEIKGKTWNDTYFVPVVTYLLMNCCDYTGRILAGLIHWPKKGSHLLVLCLMRAVFIPLFLLCNVQPRHNLPVIFNHDYHYIIIMVLFSITNGYLGNLALMCAPRVVKHHEKEIASSMVAIFLGLGLTVGSGLSIIFVKLV